jgi:ATP-dependent Lon protease
LLEPTGHTSTGITHTLESETILTPFEQAAIEEAVADTATSDLPEVLDLLPLRDAVVFPMLVAPISVSRPKYIKMIEAAAGSGERILGVVTQRTPDTEDPGLDDIHSVGVAVSIRLMGRSPDATRLIVRGLRRFTISSIDADADHLRATVSYQSDSLPVDDLQRVELEAIQRAVSEAFLRMVDLSPELPEDVKGIADATNVPDVGSMADLMASHSRLRTAQKVEVLEALDVVVRLNVLHRLLLREIQVLEVGQRIHQEAAGAMSKAQREFYLREQMKAIKRELGERPERDRELAGFRTKLKKLKLPEEAHKEVERELDRLDRLNPASPEHSVSRTYVETVLALPWSTSTPETATVVNVERMLDEDHYGLKDVKDRIIEHLAVRLSVPEGNIRQPILCLVGPPGVGKTSLGRSIARALGKEYGRISLGGVRDESEVRGHRRTYVGALPGQIITTLRRAGTNNPVIVLDEIDKMASDMRGDPASALLEALDPEQNKSFRDHYIDAPFNLSKVLFITTANGLEGIPGPLRDRMEIVDLSGYTDREKASIAAGHLVPAQRKEYMVDAADFDIAKDAYLPLIHGYTREAGVRSLGRIIGSLCRKQLRRKAEGSPIAVPITVDGISELLGTPRYDSDEITPYAGVPGTAVGLVWTSVGGDTLVLETTRMPGSKTVQLTGRLGEVMQESAKTAVSYVRANAAKLGIDPTFWETSEIHIHAPAGAVPKDGPSAGITLVTALVSLLTQRPLEEHLAMTGEVTLTGRVLPVGGLKEKLLAAHRQGCKTVIVPARNRKDVIEEVPADVRSDLNIVYVSDVLEVIDLALRAKPRAKRTSVAASQHGTPENIIPLAPTLPAKDAPPARA